MPTWIQVKDGHPRVAYLYSRHYSCYRYIDGRRRQLQYRNRNLVLGPGEKIVLITPDMMAIFGWRKFINRSGQVGVNCAFFRNEGASRSSQLILEAEKIAWDRWPGERLYTYVDPSAVESSNPGYCFQCAGWNKCGTTSARNLLILEKLPNGE